MQLLCETEKPLLGSFRSSGVAVVGLELIVGDAGVLVSVRMSGYWKGRGQLVVHTKIGKMGTVITVFTKTFTYKIVVILGP